MKTSRSVSILAGVLLSAAGIAATAANDVAVTIYNDNFGVVKEQQIGRASCRERV